VWLPEEEDDQTFRVFLRFLLVIEVNPLQVSYSSAFVTVHSNLSAHIIGLLSLFC
jgi:hypothetical protein